MSKIKICNWGGDESVVYNIEFGDMHLLSSFNAELLALMQKQTVQSLLIEKVSVTHGIERQEAESYLNSLRIEYKKINLLD